MENFMDINQLITSFWKDVANQDATALRKYFGENALINWHNTNESFSVSEYIIANCEYPETWSGQVERIEIIENIAISVTKVWSASMIVHATSFFEFYNGKIIKLDEYWGDDGAAPKWRLDKNIGKKIK